MLSMIIDLPQKVREAQQNIILHSTLLGNSVDFNKRFTLVTSGFANTLTQPLISCHNSRLFCGIFDTSARSKALNLIGHMGYYGCHACEIRGEHENK
jgi:hypothetical protein